MDELPLEGLERDARVSEIFYYFEAVTTLATGRTVGRKIGIVQEILLRKYLEANSELSRRMYLEQRLQGRSGAFHKVEFSWFSRTAVTGITVGEEIPETGGVQLVSSDPVTERVRLRIPSGGQDWVAPGMPPRRGPLREYLDDRMIDIRPVEVSEERLVLDVIDRSRLLASLESKRVGAQRFSASEKLGSGIQTIEKAKQASLVAIDLDIRHNGSVKPLQALGEEKTLISLVALGNGVHWTAKDLAVLGTYVDYTFLVKDAAIIRYAAFVQELAGDQEFLPFFMDYFQGLTKQQADDFDPDDDDFTALTPEGENRPLRQVLVDHIAAVNS